MSLNWNVGAIKTWKETGKTVADCNDSSHDGNCKICKQVPEKLVHDAAGKAIPWSITNGLIWASMVVQMDGIRTEKGAKEFAIRLAIYQELHGDFLTGGGKNGETYAITTAEVFAHIGLTTNVSTKGRASFMKAITQTIESDAAKKVAEDLLAMEDAADKPWSSVDHRNVIDKMLRDQTHCYSTLDSVEYVVGPVGLTAGLVDEIYPIAEAMIGEDMEPADEPGIETADGRTGRVVRVI